MEDGGIHSLSITAGISGSATTDPSNVLLAEAASGEMATSSAFSSEMGTKVPRREEEGVGSLCEEEDDADDKEDEVWQAADDRGSAGFGGGAEWKWKRFKSGAEWDLTVRPRVGETRPPASRAKGSGSLKGDV